MRLDVAAFPFEVDATAEDVASRRNDQMKSGRMQSEQGLKSDVSLHPRRAINASVVVAGRWQVHAGLHHKRRVLIKGREDAKLGVIRGILVWRALVHREGEEG